MIELNRLDDVLFKIISLLDSEGASDWADALRRLRAELSINPQDACKSIRGIFGGAGSFNDIVFYNERDPLIEKNGELDRLRNQLYQLVQERTSNSAESWRVE